MRVRAQVKDLNFTPHPHLHPHLHHLRLAGALAEAAGVDVNDVSVSSVSSSWGRSITEKAVRALVVFLVLVSLYIAWRFEWRMAVAAIAAMLTCRIEAIPAMNIEFLNHIRYG